MRVRLAFASSGLHYTNIKVGVGSFLSEGIYIKLTTRVFSGWTGALGWVSAAALLAAAAAALVAAAAPALKGRCALTGIEAFMAAALEVDTSLCAS